MVAEPQYQGVGVVVSVFKNVSPGHGSAKQEQRLFSTSAHNTSRNLIRKNLGVLLDPLRCNAL